MLADWIHFDFHHKKGANLFGPIDVDLGHAFFIKKSSVDSEIPKAICYIKKNL